MVILRWKIAQVQNGLASGYSLLGSSGYFWRLSARTVSVVTHLATCGNPHCSRAFLSRPELANSRHKRRNRVLCRDNELGLLFTSEWKTTFLTQGSDTRPHLVTPRLPSWWATMAPLWGVAGAHHQIRPCCLGNWMTTFILCGFFQSHWTKICKETQPPPQALLSPTSNRIPLAHKWTFQNLAH